MVSMTLAQGVTGKKIFKVCLDSFLTLLDVFLDWFVLITFWKSLHVKWALLSTLVVFLPGITCTVGEIVDGGLSSGHSGGSLHSLHRNDRCSLAKGKLRWLMILVFYPFWIFYLGYVSLHRTGDIKEMIHMKCWEGLMEAPFFFLIQIVVLQFRPFIGDVNLFGHFHFPNGQFWMSIISIIFSCLSFLYCVSEYHVLLDGEISNYIRQLKVVPYFLTHFAFRTFTLSSFWVYGKEYGILALAPLVVFNFCLTWHTLTYDRDRNYQSIKSSALTGGIISTLTPALSVFYRQTVTTKTINSFHNRNILVTNTFLAICYIILALHLNLDPDKSPLRYNVVFGCHPENTTLTPTILSIRADFFDEVKNTTVFPFLGCNRTVREPTSREYDKARGLDYRPLFLIAQPCWVNETEYEQYRECQTLSDRLFESWPKYIELMTGNSKRTPTTGFNLIHIPIVLVLFLLSSSLYFVKFDFQPD